MAMAPAIESGRVRTRLPSLPDSMIHSAAFLADDLADVMRPDDDGADARRTGVPPSAPNCEPG
jgi:hypothetical protein